MQRLRSFSYVADKAAIDQFRSFKVRENRGPRDRSQGTADVARRPRTVTRSRQRSFSSLRQQQASKAARKSARHMLELALPTL
jgi:hypothetical protein